MIKSKLSVLTLYKLPLESSPHYDSWSLRSLSYETAEKYLPEWGLIYTYIGNLYSAHTRDQKAVKKLAEKMTQINETTWEFIGHIKDLVSD